MTRIFSLFAATAVAILPLGALAQEASTAPAKTTSIAAPSQTGASVPVATSVAPGKTAGAPSDAKIRVLPKKTALRNLNHRDKPIAPVKPSEPSKS